MIFARKRRQFTHSSARAFYDKFGAKQDKQAFYEDKALAVLEHYGNFADARHIFEFGFGTGRFARRLFREHLSPEATYTGVDLSSTMKNLASVQLSDWRDRVTLRLTEGEIGLPDSSEKYDRFISSYTLDLLTDEDITRVIAEAQRTLAVSGLLCLVLLTSPVTFVGAITAMLWRLLYRLNPPIVGGCRPIQLRQFLSESDWRLIHHEIVVSRTVTSEIIVASPIKRPG